MVCIIEWSRSIFPLTVDMTRDFKSLKYSAWYLDTSRPTLHIDHLFVQARCLPGIRD